MDEDLKDVLGYGALTIFGYLGFLWTITRFTKDIHIVIIYNLLLVIILWLFFIQLKLKRGGNSKNDKKRT